MSDKSLPYMWKSDGVARNFRYILMFFFAGAVPHLQKRGFNFEGVKSIPFVSCASGINSCDVSAHVFKAGCKQDCNIQMVTAQRERSEGKHHA